MGEQRTYKNTAGYSDHEPHRAGPDEGYRAPYLDKGDEDAVAQHSIYDGAGNEIVVVTTTNDDGVVKEGTGASAEEALKDAKSTAEPIGKGFGGHA